MYEGYSVTIYKNSITPGYGMISKKRIQYYSLELTAAVLLSSDDGRGTAPSSSFIHPIIISFELHVVIMRVQTNVSSKNFGSSSVLEIITHLEIYDQNVKYIYVQFTNPMNNIQSISKVFSKAKRS